MTDTRSIRSNADPDTVHLRTLPRADQARSEQSPIALVAQATMHCGRLLKRWRRDPLTLIQSMIYPVLFLLMLRTVLGNSISSATGQNSIYGTVPLIALVAAMAGSVASAIGLRGERAAGLLARFETLPIHRGSGLLGRMLAEASRILATTVLITAVGFALGFRFGQGVIPGVVAMLVPLAFGIGFAVFVTSASVATTDFPVVETIAMVFTLLMFFNSGFVPTRAYPPWLQTVVEHNPISCAVDAMKGLTLGGPVQDALLQTIAWSVGLVLVFVVPTIRGYKRAAATM